MNPQETQKPRSPAPWLRLTAGTGVLLLAALAIYWPALRGGLVLDDAIWVDHNPFLTSFPGLLSLWRGTGLPDFFPLTSTSFWIEWHLWGENLVGYHVTNILLHAASGLMLWRILRRLAVPGAYLAALLFVVHPVNVESVAWITERKNTLCLFFCLLSVWWWLKSESEISPAGSRLSYGLSLAAFLLALLSKTSVVALPVALLGCAWWRRGKIERRDWIRSFPFFGLSVALGLVTIWFQSHRAIGAVVVLTANFWGRLAGAGWAVWFYLEKAVCPRDLVFVYPLWSVDPHSPAAYLPVVALMIIAAALCFFRRNIWARSTGFGLGYFVVMLAPVLGFVNIYYFRYSMVADHWQYFSIIGIIALLVGGISSALQNAKLKTLLAAAVLIVFSLLARQEARLFGEPRKLWMDTVEKNPGSWMAHEILGHYLGNTPEATAHFRESLRLNPNNVAAHVNLGMVLQDAGQLEEAKTEYELAQKINPGIWVIAYNLGSLYDLQGKFAEAAAAYRESIRLRPDYAETHNYLASELRKLGKGQEAVAEFREALRLNPENVEARDNLEKTLAEEKGHAPR